MIIYKVTNLTDGKVFIGRTTHALQKCKREIQMANHYVRDPFMVAIRLYGVDGFSWEELYTAADAEDLKKALTRYVKEYSETHELYNLLSSAPVYENASKFYNIPCSQLDKPDGGLCKNWTHSNTNIKSNPVWSICDKIDGQGVCYSEKELNERNRKLLAE